MQLTRDMFLRLPTVGTHHKSYKDLRSKKCLFEFHESTTPFLESIIQLFSKSRPQMMPCFLSACVGDVSHVIISKACLH